MPKKEINNYIFYKIVCLDNSVDLCYIGSTANWKSRNHNHKYNCINENSKKYNHKIYKIIRENGGWTNFKMIEIGKKEQLTKREAEQVEERYRVELKANMNTQRCYLTEEQKAEQNKEHRQKWYEANRDKIIERQIKYNEENKDKLTEYNQNYRDKNKDKINEKQKEKVKCECGCEIRRSDLSIHKKTKKHIKLMSSIKT
jgi:hypothetical protein